MPVYEYKVIPAPTRGEKAKGAKTTAERFAVALSSVMNSLGRDGWEYVRADTLPCEERVGWTGKGSSFLNMLVFRRLVEVVQPAAALAIDPPRGQITSVSPEGAAPKLPSALPEAANAPALGPARGTDHAAE